MEIDLIVPNIDHKLSIKGMVAQLPGSYPVVLSRVPAFRIPRMLGPIFSPFFLLIRAIQIRRNRGGVDGGGFDLIVCQYHPHTIILPVAAILGKILDVPIIARADDIRRDLGIDTLSSKISPLSFYYLLNELLIEFCDAFLVVCSESRRLLVSRGHDYEKIEISPNGKSEPDHGENPKFSESITSKLNRARRLLFYGRSSGPEYNLELLLKALPDVLEENPNAQLILIGEELTPGQLALSKRLGILDNLDATGPKSPGEADEILRSVDLCVGPLGTRKRGGQSIGMKILDYMSREKPSLVGMNVVSDDLLRSGKNLIVVPPDHSEIAGEINRLLKDKKRARRLGSTAKKSSDRYNWIDVASKLEKTIGRVRNSRKPFH